MGVKNILNPEISVLIPTKNGEDTIAELLAMLSIQSVKIQEIVVADSGSVDNTVSIAKSYGARVISIDPNRFDHGGTRSLLARQAAGEILLFFTQDAIPTRRESVGLLITPMLQDPEVATCYGRQLPGFNADYFASSLRRFNYPDTPQVRTLEDRAKYGLKTVFTSNSFACYRKTSLEKIGYFKDGLIFGEDTIAVGRLLKRGKKIAYVPEAAVFHSHNYSPSEECRRYFDIGVLHASEKWFLETFGSAEGQGKKYIRHELRTLIQERKVSLVPEVLVRVMLKYCGYRLGRNYLRLPRSIITKFSLHRSWWCEGDQK